MVWGSRRGQDGKVAGWRFARVGDDVDIFIETDDLSSSRGLVDARRGASPSDMRVGEVGGRVSKRLVGASGEIVVSGSGTSCATDVGDGAGGGGDRVGRREGDICRDVPGATSGG